MAKINFTKEHFDRLASLSLDALFGNQVINTKFGQALNIVELLHTTTIGTLNDIRLSLSKAIEKLESQDEWVAPEDIQEKLESLKKDKEMVNLIIGYKRFLLERQEANRKKEQLTEKLTELKEAQKTPEDKIKEIETELADLNKEEEF